VGGVGRMASGMSSTCVARLNKELRQLVRGRLHPALHALVLLLLASSDVPRHRSWSPRRVFPRGRATARSMLWKQVRALPRGGSCDFSPCPGSQCSEHACSAGGGPETVRRQCFPAADLLVAP